MSESHEALLLVEKAGFEPELTALAQTTVISMYWLRDLSKQLQLPMEEINVQHILDILRPENERIVATQKAIRSISISDRLSR